MTRKKNYLKCPLKECTRTYITDEGVEITETDFGECDKFYCAAWDEKRGRCSEYVIDDGDDDL